MNYLAHAFLSFENPGIVTGGMIADHIKGRRALDNLPGPIAAGVRLHRAIDEQADRHPAMLRTAMLFRPEYRLYAGPIVDTVMDHFLANDPACFESEAALLSFTERTYHQLRADEAWWPEAFAAYFQHMEAHNWLYNYRHLKGADRSLQGLQRRARYMPDATGAYRTFVGYYYQINQAYFEVMDDLRRFARQWLTQEGF